MGYVLFICFEGFEGSVEDENFCFFQLLFGFAEINEKWHYIYPVKVVKATRHFWNPITDEIRKRYLQKRSK